MFTAISLILAMMVTSICCAAPILATPATSAVGSNLATLVLRSSETGTGYFTLLPGVNASCGTGTQVKAGQTDSGAAAPYFGSLPLTADMDAHYTVRNLTRSTDYTACFTADSPSGFNLNAVPVKSAFTTSAVTVLTNPGWNLAGIAGFSDGASYFTSLAFAPDGTPHVAYQDWGNDGKATVKKFQIAGGWTDVGTPGISTGTASSTSLAFAPDGTPYLAYGGDDYNNVKATVMKYSSVDGWSAVGTAGVSAGTAVYTSLAFAPDGTPFVAYSDYRNSGKATVRKYHAVDGWLDVGDPPGFSDSGVGSLSLAFAPDGTPHVAFQDQAYSARATVMKFSAGSWSVVGAPGFSAGVANSTSLAFAPDGSLYVAYQDGGKGDKATVMKYSSVDGWIPVGNTGFSAGVANSTSLAFAPDGAPHVAYGDDGNGGKATVMKYGGSAWSVVATAGFSAGPATATSLAFAPDGTPYVAYGDDGTGSRASVMKLNNFPTITGTPDATVVVGTAYNFNPEATNATRFSVKADLLPPGITFSEADGSLSGTPTVVGIYRNIVITAINTFGSTSLPAFTLEVVGTTPPDTTIISKPDNPTSSPSYTFTFSASQTGSTFECSLNGGTFGACSGSGSHSGSFTYPSCIVCRSDSALSFAVRAKNSVGTDPTPASYAWTVNHPLQTPFDNVSEGGAVQLQATDLAGNVNVNRGVSFTLSGGYDPGYSTQSGTTTIHGTVTFSAGTVTVENIVIM
jgi:hypothetical protein